MDLKRVAPIIRVLNWFKKLLYQEEVEFTLVGLRNSGKTTFVKVIANERCKNVVSTIGFNMWKFKKGNLTIKVWDVGGQNRFRVLWHKLSCGIKALIYMVDAADLNQMEASRKALHSLLDRPELAQIPVLVLGNKKDLPGALGEAELKDKMDLNSIQDREVCCYSISCKEKDNVDITLQWLIAHSRSYNH